MARREYSEEIRAAVMAALLTGQSISSVAREYNIPKGTVGGWKHEANGTSPTQKTEIGELLMIYLRRSLQTLTEQLMVFGNATWLRKQPASEAAVLHGVLADKAIRLLEALSTEDTGANS